MTNNLPMRAFVRRVVYFCGAIVIAGALIGCSADDDYPKDWQPVVTANADQCPDIAGTFAIDDKAAYYMLGGHYENNPRTWSVMSIAGNPQVGLQIALYEVGSGAPYEQPIKRNRGNDYQCSDGWLELAWPIGHIPMRSEDDRVPADDLMDKSLSLAKNSAGDLVIRTNVSHWKGFSVWCGDGCKYIPIPFTRKTYYTWSRWLPVPIPTYRPPTANAEKYDIDAPDKLTRDAKAEAERLRIQESKAHQDKEKQLIKLLLPSFPKDMVTTAYSLSAEGFLVEVRHKDEDAFYQLIVNAHSSGYFTDAKIKSRKYVDGYGLQVVDVLLTPKSTVENNPPSY